MSQPRSTGNQAMFRFLRPYRGALGVAAGLTLAETVLDLARPWPLKLVVDNAIGGQALRGMLSPLDDLSPAAMAAVAALLTLALVGIGAVVGYLITYLSGAAAERIGADLREPVTSPGSRTPWWRGSPPWSPKRSRWSAWRSSCWPSTRSSGWPRWRWLRCWRWWWRCAPSSAPWTSRRATRRWPTCCWPAAAAWCCGSAWSP